MRRLFRNVASLLILSVLSVSVLFAGNEQRAGQAGAQELLINPWARSSGLGGANAAAVRGLESIYMNVAGTAFTRKTELVFSHSQWLYGSGIGIYSFGLSQKVGEAGVMSLAVMSLDFGKIDITTAEQPEGNIGTYHPQFTNISVAFAKEFSNSIYGGAAIKVINEGISDLKATGVAIDAGIQYVTGLGKDKAGNKYRDNLKFGISMKNVGPEMSYGGDGLSFRSESPWGVVMTSEYRSSSFELPSLINIGFNYDMHLGQKVDSANSEVSSSHRLSLGGCFTSNSFTKDQIRAGLEYGWREMLMFRVGFVYEEGIFEDAMRSNVFTGPVAGVSFELPLNKETGSTFALDYSYRATSPFKGCHTIGAKVSL